MTDHLPSKELVAKFKRGDIVRWNALALHGTDRDGWAIQGLETAHSLLPIYRVRRGRQTGSAVENELEVLDAPEVCPEHVTTWAPGCPSCIRAQDAKRAREQNLLYWAENFDAHFSKPADTHRLVRSLLTEIDRLSTALRGIQSCSTCEACRGAAARALGDRCAPVEQVGEVERLRRDMAAAVEEIRRLRAENATLDQPVKSDLVQQMRLAGYHDWASAVERLQRPWHEREAPHCPTCGCGLAPEPERIQTGQPFVYGVVQSCPCKGHPTNCVNHPHDCGCSAPEPREAIAWLDDHDRVVCRDGYDFGGLVSKSYRIPESWTPLVAGAAKPPGDGLCPNSPSYGEPVPRTECIDNGKCVCEPKEADVADLIMGRGDGG